MFDKFTQRARMVMGKAREHAHLLHHDYIGTEHVLLGLLEVPDGVAGKMLRALEADVVALATSVGRRVQRGSAAVPPTGQIPFTPRMKRALECALAESQRLKHTWIGTEHLLLGLIAERDGIAAAGLLEAHVSRAAALLAWGAVVSDDAPAAGPASGGPASGEAPRAEPPAVGGGGPTAAPAPTTKTAEAAPAAPAAAPAPPKSQTPALDAFSKPVPAPPPELVLDPLHEEVVLRLLRTLGRRGQPHAVLVGAPGSGRTTLVGEVARRIERGAAPKTLRGARVAVLDLPLVFAGTKFRGQLEERLKAIETEARRKGPLVLVVPDVAHLLHTGFGDRVSSLGAADVLLPAVFEAAFLVLAVATPERWRSVCAEAPWLAARLECVEQPPAGAELCQRVLQAHLHQLERRHDVMIDPGAVGAAVEGSAAGPRRLAQPGAALALLEEAAVHRALLAVQGKEPPREDAAVCAEVQALEQRKEEFVSRKEFEQAGEAVDRLVRLRRTLLVVEPRHVTAICGPRDDGGGAPAPLLPARGGG